MIYIYIYVYIFYPFFFVDSRSGRSIFKGAAGLLQHLELPQSVQHRSCPQQNRSSPGLFSFTSTWVTVFFFGLKPIWFGPTWSPSPVCSILAGLIWFEATPICYASRPSYSIRPNCWTSPSYSKTELPHFEERAAVKSGLSLLKPIWYGLSSGWSFSSLWALKQDQSFHQCSCPICSSTHCADSM